MSAAAFDAALARERRRPSRAGWGAAALALCGLFFLISLRDGPVPLLLALALSVAPVPLLLVLVLALDRLEPEPTRNLSLAFVWGATGAVIVAGIVNTIGLSVSSVLLGPNGGTSVYITLGAPVVEETLKAAVLISFLVRRCQELDGPTDGIIYACMVGLGFALSENVTYYMAALLREGPGGLALTFVLRGVVSPLLHPLFTSMTGIALGWAALLHSRAARVLLPAAGLCGAILLHALWNGSASIGLGALVLVYALVMAPALAAVVLVTQTDRRRILRLVQRLLPQVTPEGLVTWRDLEMLSSLDRRQSARRSVRRARGPTAARALGVYQHAATELALAYDRLERGVADERWVQHRREVLLPIMDTSHRAFSLA